MDYRAPAALQAATVGLFAASGLAVAYVLEAGLGDATWGVSTGAQGLVSGRRSACHVLQWMQLHAGPPYLRPCSFSSPRRPACSAHPSCFAGLGACMGAAMYEAGRPRRLSVEEAQQKEEVWQDFGE